MSAHRKNRQRKPLSKRMFTMLFTIFFAFLTLGATFTVAGFTNSGTATTTVSSGSIDLTLNAVKTYTWNLGTDLYPGGYSNQTVRIANNGTIPLSYKVTTSSYTGTIIPKLTATIIDNGVTTFEGPLSAVNSTASTIAPGTGRSIILRHTWTPAANDDSFERVSGRATLTFTATQ